MTEGGSAGWTGSVSSQTHKLTDSQRNVHGNTQNRARMSNNFLQLSPCESLFDVFYLLNHVTEAFNDKLQTQRWS